jgi:pimeloyl-ACP methyl ester carboxylesterase
MLDAAMPDLDTGQAIVHYSDRGPHDVPPVMLLHAIGYDHRAWQPVVAELERGYRVVAPDLRGHGRSSTPVDADEYSPARQALDVMALADHLGFELFALAGWELGGAVALHLARTAPDRLAALVLVDTSAAPSGAAARPPEQVALAERFGPRGAARRRAATLDGEYYQDAVVQLATRTSADGFCNSLRAWGQAPDLSGELGQIVHCPTMVVASEGGPLARTTLDIAVALPDARTIGVADAAPTALSTRPDTVARLIRDFLHDVEEGRPTGGTWRV